MLPWAVIVIRFSAEQQIAGAELLRYAEDNPPIAVHAAFHAEEVLGQRLEELQMGRSGRAIVAHIRVIRAFLVIYPPHKFRDDGVHVRVPLAVRVRRQVQRHIVDEDGEIRAVVEIETAKKILVGLSAAGVLCDHDAGNRLQNFS